MSIMTSLIPSDLDSLLVVRTVTVFLPAPYCAPSIFVPSLDRAVSHAKALRGALQAAGITVQTIRVSLPGPSIFGSPSAALSAAKELDRLDLDYANLGCVHPSDSAFVSSDFYEAVLVSTSSVSLSAQLTAAPGVISPPAVRAAADAVARISHLTAAGFSNFRFAASAHVLPGGPFFPTSYATTELSAASSMNDPPPAALGIQGGTLLSAIVSRSRSPQLALETFRACVQAGVNRLIDICAAVAPVSVDFSTAPLPEDGHGVGEPLRQLANVQNFPSAGGLAAAARVAAAIDAASFPRAGFCGIMLPVSEDSVLSANPPKLQDLLMCSSVCGTGLDTVPIPGDTSNAVIEDLLMDIAALSCRLGCKPLTARLMPMPGLSAGEMTQFTSPYFSNGPVIAVNEKHGANNVNDGGDGSGDEEDGDGDAIEICAFRR